MRAAREANVAYRDAWAEPEHQLEEGGTVAGGAFVPDLKN